MTKRRCYYYFLIVLIGGIGCWISAFQHLNQDPNPISGYAFCGNLATFSISLAVMSFADFILVSQDKFPATRALGFLIIVALSVAAGVVTLLMRDGIGVSASWISISGASILWWAIHSRNPAFDEPSSAISTLGGPV